MLNISQKFKKIIKGTKDIMEDSMSSIASFSMRINRIPVTK